MDTKNLDKAVQRMVSLPLPLAKALLRLADNCDAPYWVWYPCKDCLDLPGAMEASDTLHELVEQANNQPSEEARKKQDHGS